MAFSAIEISNIGGKPVALYEFMYGNTIWRYTTNDEDLELGEDEDDNPIIYIAGTISDSGVTQGGSDQNDLTIVVPVGFPVADLFRTGQPSGKVWLSVRRYHLGDDVTETPLIWSGSVVNSVQTDDATEEMSGRSLAGTYDRNGLRFSWERMCPHVLYGETGCRVNKADHEYPRTVATLDSLSFTCTAHSEPEEGSFSGGFVEWARGDGSFERRGIELQDGNHFAVLGFTTGMEIGQAITLYPGCGRDTATCKLFDNLKNYGGFPHLPGQSPFGGAKVF